MVARLGRQNPAIDAFGVGQPARMMQLERLAQEIGRRRCRHARQGIRR
jgi:hypothetical protein